MKTKFLALTACLLFSAPIFAQIKNDRGTFTKPEGGAWTIESQMSPNLVGQTIFSLNEPILQNLFAGIDREAVNSGLEPGSLGSAFPLLRLRKFKSEKIAWRILFNLSYASSKMKSDPDGGETTTLTNNELGLGLGGGIEKHLIGAERLSTYIGGDLQFAFGKYGVKAKAAETIKHSQSGIALGLRAFTGMEYYIMPKIYLGIEIGYGFSFNSYGVQKNSGGNLENGTDSNNNLVFTPFISPSFRLGWRI